LTSFAPRLCANCGAENLPLAPVCSRCGADLAVPRFPAIATGPRVEPTTPPTETGNSRLALAIGILLIVGSLVSIGVVAANYGSEPLVRYFVIGRLDHRHEGSCLGPAKSLNIWARHGDGRIRGLLICTGEGTAYGIP
jgi:hypothetical protein